LFANGANFYPFAPGYIGPIYIARDRFDGDPVDAITTILHESQHDVSQKGIGHGQWVDDIENTFKYILSAVAAGSIEGVDAVSLKIIFASCGLEYKE